MINLYKYNAHGWLHNTYWLVLSEDVMIYTHTKDRWYYIKDGSNSYINAIDPFFETLEELL